MTPRDFGLYDAGGVFSSDDTIWTSSARAD